MSRIQKLPSEIAEKIAAGEVVERPFSVVKELVENSLDAGASRIEIFIEDGGRKLIRVQDEGCGMTPEEMKLSLERHATSKLHSLEDLFSILSLGFRGEALPSVAAISRFTLKSRSQETTTLSGYEIFVEGGKVLRSNETGHPLGTTIEVRDLFYNTPARLKFLKSNETEWGHIEDYLMGMALAYPEVQFIAHHQNKEKIRWTQRGIKPRLFEVFGADVVEGLYPVRHERDSLILEGFVSHPHFSRSSNSSLFLFLNQRLIKDRLLNHAVMAGYRHLLMKDQYPLVVLSLKMPPHLVDVNVHPTKREVRFAQPNVVHQFVAEAIGKTLAEAPWTRSNAHPPPNPLPSREGEKEQKLSFLTPSPLAGEGRGEGTVSNQNWFSSNYKPLAESSSFSRVGRLPFSSLLVIGQLKGTYILCQSEAHLVLIDQHAAHERIGFEKLRRAYQAGKIPMQQLLIPQMIEVKESEKEFLQPHLKNLKNMGLLIEEFGETTWVVKGIPALLGNAQILNLIKSLIVDLQEHGSSQKLEDYADELFASMACHQQIRAGDSLSLSEMQELVNELDEDASHYHCPHGRPVMVQIGFQEIEKWFKRVL